MFKAVKNFKLKNMTWQMKNYLSTYLVVTVNIILFFLLALLDIDVVDDGFMSAGYLLYALIEYVFFIPASLIIYGIISYKRTKKIILPNLLLFFTLFIFTFFAANIRKNSVGFQFLGDSLSVASIAVLFSLIPSIITAIDKRVEKRKRAKKDRDGEEIFGDIPTENSVSNTPKPVNMRLQYLKLIAFWGTVLLGFFIATTITKEGIGYSLYYTVFFCPLCALLYGCLTYSLTQKVFLPNLFLYLISTVTYIIADLITLPIALPERNADILDILATSQIFTAPFLVISIALSLFPLLFEVEKKHINDLN